MYFSSKSLKMDYDFTQKQGMLGVKLEAKQHLTFLEKKGNGKETLFLHTFLFLYKKQPFF